MQSIDLNQVLIAKKINISFWIFQHYIKNDDFLPNSIENSVQSVRIWNISCSKAQSLFEDIWILKSKMKLVKHIQLQFSNFSANFLKLLFSIYKVPDLNKIEFGKKPSNSAILRFTVFNINVLWKKEDETLLLKIK